MRERLVVLGHFLLPPSVTMAVIPAALLLLERGLSSAWTSLPVGPASWLGIPALLAAVWFEAWSAVEFIHAGGTWNFFNPPRRLVTTGPYRYSRHPVYVGGVVAIAGLALLFRSAFLAIYLACYLVAVDRILIPLVEEPGLERRFGDEYRDYRRRVRRWL